MRRSGRYLLGAATAGAVLWGAAGCCRCGGRTAIDGARGATDRVELESENEFGPPASLRNGSGDTVITRRKTPGLPARVDAITNHDLAGYLNTLAYNSAQYSTETETVPCVHGTNGSPCTGADSAHVLIQPEAGMSERDYTDVPPNGLIVARIINDAAVDLDAATFGYPAQRKTWWVVDDSAGGLRSRFFVRTYSSTGPAIRFVTPTRPYVRCSHPDAPAGRPARAKFWTCAQSAADTVAPGMLERNRSQGGGGGDLSSYIHTVSLRSPVPVPPAPPPYLLTTNWVSCGAGCCATSP